MDVLDTGSAVFGLVGVFFALVGAGGGFALIRSLVIRKRVLAGGVTVEARCLDTFQRGDSEGGRTRYAILGFTTRDGQDVRIQLAITGPIVPGDFVPVRYDPARPKRAVLIGTRTDAVANGCGTVVGLIVFSVFVVVGLGFAVGGFGLLTFGSGVPDPSGYVPDPSFAP